ncbi:hypothetical protein [Aridibaculum aurantiacum]|nr:hypothetical protein [Aridibaculum aurantiacum]
MAAVEVKLQRVMQLEQLIVQTLSFVEKLATEVGKLKNRMKKPVK